MTNTTTDRLLDKLRRLVDHEHTIETERAAARRRIRQIEAKKRTRIRTQVIQSRVTADEYRQILEHARTAKLSLSEYLRRAALKL